MKDRRKLELMPEASLKQCIVIRFCSRVPFCCGASVRKTSVVDMDVHDDHAHRGAARRRLRAFRRYEKLSLAMQMATASHHSRHRAGRADASTQASTYTDAATCAATAAPENVAPAPVTENIAPASAVTHAVPSQQLPPAYTTATVAADVNLDITGLVSPHQEQIVTGEMTQNIIENSAVQELLIVQEILRLWSRYRNKLSRPPMMKQVPRRPARASRRPFVVILR